MREFKLLINGKLVPGVARLDVINPATEEVLAGGAASRPRAVQRGDRRRQSGIPHLVGQTNSRARCAAR